MPRHAPPRTRVLAVHVIGHETKYYRIQGGFALGLPPGLKRLLGPGPARSFTAPGVRVEVIEIGPDEFGRRT